MRRLEIPHMHRTGKPSVRTVVNPPTAMEQDVKTVPPVPVMVGRTQQGGVFRYSPRARPNHAAVSVLFGSVHHSPFARHRARSVVG